MSAVTLASSSMIGTSPTASIIPDALQQFLRRIEEHRNANLRASEGLHSLKVDLESRWRIASSEGDATSTVLYQILEFGWREWKRITA